MDIKQESGRRIGEARANKKLKLREVCEQIHGLSETALNNYESGTRMVSVTIAKRLAPVLGVSAAYLLTVDDALSDDETTLLRGYRLASDERKTDMLATAERVLESSPLEKAKAA